MANDSFKIKNSINLSASSGSTSEAGDLRRRASDDELVYNDGTDERVVINDNNISSFAVTDPTTTDEDIIVRRSGALARLGVGTEGQVLKVVSGQVDWDADISGGSPSASTVSVTPAGNISSTNAQAALEELDSEKEPTLSKGDLTEITSSVLTITGGTGAVIGSGTSIEVQQATGAQDGYLSSSDFTTFNDKLTDPLTTDGDIIIRDTTTTRLAVGTEGQVLTVASGLPSWSDAASSTLTVRTGSGSITVLTSDDILIGDATSGTCIVVLPEAGSVSGQAYTVKRADNSGNILQVQAAGVEQIDGAGSINIDIQYQAITVVSDGSNWRVTSSYPRNNNWTSYTPTFAGFGTVSNAAGRYKVDGDSLKIMASCTTGTVAATTFTLSLPSGFNIDSSKLTINNLVTGAGQRVGRYNTSNAAANNGGEIITAPATSTSLVYAAVSDATGGSGLNPTNGNAVSASGVVFSCQFEVPIG